MKNTLLILSMLVALVGSARAQYDSPSKSPSTPSQVPDQVKPIDPAPVQEAVPQTAEGQLTKVDSQKQLLWIRTLEGQEMQFSYTKDTAVEGSSGTVEGLATMSGTQLKIQFRSEGGVNTALAIEVQTVASR